MKRRNAESCKMRRPVKRTKITEGMYGSSMLYLKFVMLWASVVMVDYMLEFRFEFLWPVWMMLKSVYDSYKYQGLAFSFFFVCITITSDMICFCFIPLQYIFFVASTYVWVQYVWYTLCVRGPCLPAGWAVAGAAAAAAGAAGWSPGPPRSSPAAAPLAAIAAGHVLYTLASHAKTFLCQRIRIHWQHKVREHNEDYFQFLKETLQSDEVLHPDCLFRNMESTEVEREPRVRKRTADVSPPKVVKPDRHVPSLIPHKTSNGVAHGSEEDKHEPHKASAKSTKYEKKEGSTFKEERRKNRNKDKDSDSHKSTEQTKEQILRVADISTNTKDSLRKDNSSTREKEKEREREMKERERELREKEREIREREKEREKEREQELREAREMSEELKRVKAELTQCRAAELETKKALAAALDKQRQLADSQHKLTTWRTSEKAVLERSLRDEKRARARAELKLTRAISHTQNNTHKQHSGECENDWCKSARAESGSLKRELVRQSEQIRSLEACQSSCSSAARDAAQEQAREQAREQAQDLAQELRARGQQLQRALSAETRVKLDLLSALGAAKRHITIQEGLISRQEKELEELKAQMLAVMPTEYIQNLNHSRRVNYSALDPNASAYTPKQLLTDA